MIKNDKEEIKVKAVTISVAQCMLHYMSHYIFYTIYVTYTDPMEKQHAAF